MNVVHRNVSFLFVSLSALVVGCSSAAESPNASDMDRENAEAQSSALAESGPACAGVNPEDIEHACLHANSGPFRTVTATPLAAAPTQNVNTPHTAWTVNLANVNGKYEGSILFRAPETADYAFYTGKHVPIQILDGDTGVAIESSCQIPTADCDKLKRQDIAELTADKTYRINFGPNCVKSFLLVLEESGHHHEE